MKRSPAPINVSLAGGWMNEAGEIGKGCGKARSADASEPLAGNINTLKAIAGAVATTSRSPFFANPPGSKSDENKETPRCAVEMPVFSR